MVLKLRQIGFNFIYLWIIIFLKINNTLGSVIIWSHIDKNYR